MDIAKIRKKAKEKEKKERDAEESRKQTEAVAGNMAPPPELEQEREGTSEEAGPVKEEEPAGGTTIVLPGSQGETVAPLPSVNKEGDRGFSGEKDFGAEGALVELLTFRISNEEFAFRVSAVEEIARYHKITMVPTLPDYVLGVTSLRGKIIPVLDLSKRLLLKEAAAPGGPEKRRDSKILILEGPRGLIGAAIDKVLGVVRFEEGNVLEPPGHLSEEERKYIEGVVILEKHFISIIRSYDALDVELI